MKATQYSGKLITKNNETVTQFVIGNKVSNKLANLIIAMGGCCTKVTNRASYYEIKGDKINLCMLI